MWLFAGGLGRVGMVGMVGMRLGVCWGGFPFKTVHHHSKPYHSSTISLQTPLLSPLTFLYTPSNPFETLDDACLDFV